MNTINSIYSTSPEYHDACRGDEWRGEKLHFATLHIDAGSFIR